MEKVCPICNKLKTIEFICDKCGDRLVDKGRMQEYLDGYSADREIKDYKEYCLHIFSCNNCNHKQREYIHKILL